MIRDELGAGDESHALRVSDNGRRRFEERR